MGTTGKPFAHELGHAISYDGKGGWLDDDPAFKTAWEKEFTVKDVPKDFEAAIERDLTKQGVSDVERFDKKSKLLREYQYPLGSVNATENPREGFAEFFAAYLTGSDAERRELKEKFPLTWEFMKQHGLIVDPPPEG